jgi:putative endonuclease
VPPWYVYILYSEVSRRLYTGISTSPARRLSEHNAGKGAKATRAGRPWKIAHTEVLPTKSSALKREAAIKKLKRAGKLLLITSDVGENGVDRTLGVAIFDCLLR